MGVETQNKKQVQIVVGGAWKGGKDGKIRARIGWML